MAPIYSCSVTYVRKDKWAQAYRRSFYNSPSFGAPYVKYYVIHLLIYLTSFSQLVLFLLNGKMLSSPPSIKRELLVLYKTIVLYPLPAWPAKYWRGLYVVKLLTTYVKITFSIQHNMDSSNGDLLRLIYSNV